MTRRTIFFSACLAVAVALLGCEGVRNVIAFEQGLAKEFDAKGVKLEFKNGRLLIVTLQNSRLADLAESEQKATCRKVAEYVRDHYSDYARLREIQVVLARKEDAGPVTLTESSTACSFSTAELGRPTGGQHVAS